MNYLGKAIKITVCADGFVSIMRNAKDRRLRAALPCYSVDTMEQALMLIKKVCVLRACAHGGKTGTIIEPWAPNWPLMEDADVSLINDFAEILRHAEEENNDDKR